MKTPINILYTAIGYWIAVYGVTQVPNIINNYYLNLVWLTVVIPNVFHMVVLTYIMNKLFKKTAEDLKKYGTDKGKTLKTNALLMGMLSIGAIITYFSGIDKSIYSNMGWENGAAVTV